MRLPVGIAIVIIASTAIARGQSLHDQAICDDHAQKAFEAHNNHGTELGITLLNGHFQSHYNAKLNKCFVLIDTVEKQQGQYQTTLALMDAMEGRALGLFVESKSPLTCILTPTPELTKCSSRAEFDTFVSKYMER